MNDKLTACLERVRKPARYTGGEYNSIIKDKSKIDVRFAFCFPDTYEIGMSHIGMKILYHLINERDDSLCERFYAPWPDMEEMLRENEMKLFSLENKKTLDQFDIVGFTLQYEMSYTNILNMLSMSDIPLRSADRNKNDEFFTLYEDIQREVNAYIEYNPNVFKDKTVLLPCDDPEWSNFTRFFAQNFENLGLKKLICTCYESSPIAYEQLSFDNSANYIAKTEGGKPAYKIEITEVEDYNGDGAVDLSDVEIDFLLNALNK